MSIVSIRSQVDVPLLRPDGRVQPSSFISFNGLYSGKEHFAVRLGQPGAEPPLVRLHSECATGDLFGSARCDCGPQLSEAIDTIAQTFGYILYLRQEGRGIGLSAKLEAYILQGQGFDTYAANRHLGLPDDLRDYTEAALMLKAIGATSIALLSNNPDKARQLSQHGIHILDKVPTDVHCTANNEKYLQAKVAHTGHCPSEGYTSPKLTADNARWGSQHWKTKSSSAPR